MSSTLLHAPISARRSVSYVPIRRWHASAIFLFLLGVTFAFLMDSQEKKGVDSGARWLASMGRSGYLFAAASLFVFSCGSSHSIKVPGKRVPRDILNCMGFALLILR